MDSAMTDQTGEHQCRLLQLPDEVKLEIVNQVDQRRDLYNFSLACRDLEDMTLGRLYNTIDLDIPSSKSPDWSQDALPTFRPYVLQNMRELSIRHGASDQENPIYNKRRRSDANTMESYVAEVFGGVPQDRLKSFSFLHQTPMSSRMLDGLIKSQGNGLKHLQCCELELMSSPEVSLPSNLRSLECRSVLSGETITKLIEANKNTLTTLSLGQDKHLLQKYRQRRIGFVNNTAQLCEAFYTCLDLSTIPNLKHLALTGLNLAPLLSSTAASASFLNQLESLSLESCPNTSSFLDILAQTFSDRETPTPSLKKFSFRHEFLTVPLQTSLVNFLTSFNTLQSLAILTENTDFTSPASTMLKPHGQNLRQLTLESRIQPREHLHLDTSRPFGQTATPQVQLWLDNITDICTLCPNLEELGTALPWDDEAVKSHMATMTSQKLTHLETLHIRNCPLSRTAETLSTEKLEEYANNFITQCSPQSLETLAIGPTLYASRWRLSSACSSAPPPPPPTEPLLPQSQPLSHSIPPTTTTTTTPSTPARRRNPPTLRALATTIALLSAKKNLDSPPDHLRTHYFSVKGSDRSKSRKIEIERVTERHMEEIRGRLERGGLNLGGVFASVWLR